MTLLNSTTVEFNVTRPRGITESAGKTRTSNITDELREYSLTQEIHSTTEGLLTVHSPTGIPNILNETSETPPINVTNGIPQLNVTNGLYRTSQFNLTNGISECNATQGLLGSTWDPNGTVEIYKYSEYRWYYTGLLIVPLWILFGNLMVLLAVRRQRNLRTLSNLVIASLAVTDLLLSLCVVPLNAYQLVSGRWNLGLWPCLLWTCMDVWLSTTSIMHLCAIAIHRYLAIAFPLRVRNYQTTCHVIALLVPAWCISFAISIPQLVQGLLSNRHVLRELSPGMGLQCGIFDQIFTVYSSIVSFFFPLAIMVFADIRSVQILRKSSTVPLDPSFAHMCDNSKSMETNCTEVDVDPDLKAENGGVSERQPLSKRDKNEDGLPDSEMIQLSSPASPTSEIASPFTCESTRSRSSSVYVGVLSSRGLLKVNSREKRAEKTLIWVFVCFVVFWVPFFCTNITYGICSCNIPDAVFLCFTWLGYISSGVNPCIYAFLNKDFRDAFINILTCRPPARSRLVFRPMASCNNTLTGV